MSEPKQPGVGVARLKPADSGKPRFVIQIAPEDPFSERDAQRLASFIEKACGKAPPDQGDSYLGPVAHARDASS